MDGHPRGLQSLPPAASRDETPKAAKILAMDGKIARVDEILSILKSRVRHRAADHLDGPLSCTH